MEKYVAAEFEIIKFDAEDVITASPEIPPCDFD